MRIGAHFSISKGLHKAVEDAAYAGASTLQIFTASRTQWSMETAPYTESDLDLWETAKKKHGISDVLVHAGFLINLATDKQKVYDLSIKALRAEICRAELLNAKYLVVHPGFRMTNSVDDAINQVVMGVKQLSDVLTRGNAPLLLLENLAGQGSAICANFEEVGALVHKITQMNIPIGVCLDTCHLFVAGYDIRTYDGLSSVLEEFDAKVGLDYLKAMHVNDSMFDINSRKDRHAHLGEGLLGSLCFSALMQHPDLKHINKYLETPGDVDSWREEIKWLYQQQKCYK